MEVRESLLTNSLIIFSESKKNNQIKICILPKDCREIIFKNFLMVKIFTRLIFYLKYSCPIS